MPILSPIGAATSGAFGLPKSASGGGASDPYYEYVTMLLTGDGTNGAQNNTFIDSSTNNTSITRYGNTTQGAFSPYGSLWGVDFSSASSSYQTVAQSVDLYQIHGRYPKALNSSQHIQLDPLSIL